ncbi:hypothetical protein OFO03_00265 [Campylobacter sp. JMF_02 ED1]|uniref:hypothetical protein n=1 Tax=unclassified Campylobacter TaxID=2593542 RepID=UPI0022E9F396|nr:MULTISPECIES: hypothetical protein [unclassified Campylobacter]MDA3048946.1 hypothetical protein [Campylobacter sp. JMF_15 NE4]MDA3050343.1 hypothetical protein [Campylobacter sp. JMF_02 ED1]
MKNLSNIFLSFFYILLLFSLNSCGKISNDELCEKGDEKACFVSGKFYDDNNESVKALQFYAKSCELNYALGCDKIAQDYAQKDDTQNAKKFFLKSCELNHHESCLSYGEIFENEGDCDKASEIYKDTFKNKKYKPASDKFDNLIKSEKCLGTEIIIKKEIVNCEPNEGLEKYFKAMSYLDSHYDEKKSYEIIALFEKSCKCGIALSCNRAAMHIARYLGFGNTYFTDDKLDNKKIQAFFLPGRPNDGKNIEAMKEYAKKLAKAILLWVANNCIIWQN